MPTCAKTSGSAAIRALDWRRSAGRRVSRITRRRTRAVGALARPLSLRLQGRASGTPPPGLSLDAARKDASDREEKRNLRRGAPPGRWPQRGKAVDWAHSGRRPSAPSLARGRCRGRAADAGSRPRYRSASGGPPLHSTRHTRHAQPTAAVATHAARYQPRNGTACAVRASPLKTAQRLSGGRLRSRQGRTFGASLRDGASATLDRTWPRVPRTPWRLSG